MRFDSIDDIERLIAHRVAEAPSLEFKRELPFETSGQKLEALKDLTAMGNGGGGTVLYGLDEEQNEWPVAAAVTPLTDRSLVSRLEDVVRDAVRPPLLWTLGVIEGAGGYLLAADVEPSPLGPYMVQAYGNLRYHRRIGRRTEPMAEQQVRDAYALATRFREHRGELWGAHHLPLAPAEESDPWLTVSALPEEPLAELFDLRSIDPESVTPPPLIKLHVDLTHLGAAVGRLGRWADGLFGHDGTNDSSPYANVRLHRDGAAGLGRRLLHTELSGIFTARLLNAELAYLSWFWNEFGLRRPVELVVDLSRVSQCTLEVGSWFHEKRVVHEPPGVPVTSVTLTENVLPWELRRAVVRHRLVQRFVDRLFQAFGLSKATAMFMSGQLYRQDAGPLGFSVAGRGVWNNEGQQLGVVQEDGAVLGAASGALRAWWQDGCLLDPAGSTMGVVELAIGHGVPDDFLAGRILEDPRARVPGGDPGDPAPVQHEHLPIAPTGRWTETNHNLVQYFAAT